MSSYMEVPLFLDSKASRLIQLADLVAYTVFRCYTHSDDQDRGIVNRVLSSFDQEPYGPIHGLVHLVGNYRVCDCVACRSRR